MHPRVGGIHGLKILADTQRGENGTACRPTPMIFGGVILTIHQLAAL